MIDPFGTADLAIRGEFTVFSALTLKEQLLAVLDGRADQSDVVIDLSDVTEFDSAGLQLMLLVKREAVLVGKTVRFVRHADVVLDLIDLCDLAGEFGDPVVIRSHG